MQSENKQQMQSENIPVLTVSPQKLNLGTDVPNTPATTGPDAIPVCVT